MKVLHAVHGFPPDMVGGTEQHVVQVTRALAARGHAVLVLAGSLHPESPPGLREEVRDEVRVFRYHGPRAGRAHWSEFHDLIAERLVQDLLARERPDLVHVHHWLRLTANLVALARAAGIPTVVTLHDTWTVCPRLHRLKGDLVFCRERYRPDLCVTCAPRYPWQDDEEASALLAARYHTTTAELQLADRLLVPSRSHAELLAVGSGLPASRFVVLPHPSLTRLARTEPEPARTPGQPLKIGLVGVLLPHKGPQVLVDALPLLPVGRYTVHIFGAEPDDGYAAHLKRLAQEYPVTFHGAYEPADVARAGLDVVVLPSLAPESFSFTLDEALQAGLPVIVSDRGALPDRAGAAGLVVPAESPSALAHAIRRLMDEPPLLPTLREAAAQYRPRELEDHVTALEKIYSEVGRDAGSVRLPASEPVALEALRYRQVLERDRALERQTTAMAQLQSQLDAQTTGLKELRAQVEPIRARVRGQQVALAEQQFHLQRLQMAIDEVTYSRGWNFLTLFRELKGAATPATLGSLRAIRRSEGWRGLRQHLRQRVEDLTALARGVIVAPKAPTRAAAEAAAHSLEELENQYQVWTDLRIPTREQLETWRETLRGLAVMPLISIVTPVYNVEEAWLRKAVESVRAQLYDRWELYLVNDASSRPHIRPALDACAELDPRIRVVHLPVRRGIVGASNEGLKRATGEFIALLDHDDELSVHALLAVVGRLNRDPSLDLIYSDEDKVDEHGRRFEPAFKPDWSPDLLRAMNYIGHLCVFRTELVRKLGGFRPGFDGSQDYDLLLRLTESTDRVAHIPDILYSWRTLPGSSAGSLKAKTYAYDAAVRALRESAERRGWPAEVLEVAPGRYATRYRVRGRPLVSLLIPMRDRAKLTAQCLKSIEEKSTHRPYEIVIVDNGSVEPETLEFLRSLSSPCRVLRYDAPFNYSAINNFAARHVQGEYLIFLNNDTEVISPDWVEAMVEHAQRPEVGAVGARLIYPSGLIQHAGVFIMGTRGAVAGHAFKGLPADDPGYLGFTEIVRNVSAVTGACMAIRREVFEQAGGFDEGFEVAFGDVDLCLRIREQGYVILYTPHATLYHHESASRGTLHPPQDDARFRRRWRRFFQGDRDPFWNPNLSVESERFGLVVSSVR